MPNSYSETTSPAVERQAAHVLLVEPDEELLSIRALLLTIAGYRLKTASSHPEAFILLTETCFDVILISTSLGKDRLHAAAEFARRHWPRTRIILLGEVTDDFEDQLYDEVVHCSHQPDELLRTVQLQYERHLRMR